MSTSQNLTVTLPAELLSTVRDAVQAGEYASASELVGEALRHWTSERALSPEALKYLREQIRIGDESGESVPAIDAFAEARAAIDEVRSHRG